MPTNSFKVINILVDRQRQPLKYWILSKQYMYILLHLLRNIECSVKLWTENQTVQMLAPSAHDKWLARLISVEMKIRRAQQTRKYKHLHLRDVRPPTKTDRASILDLSSRVFVSLTGALVCYHTTIKCIDRAASPWVGVSQYNWADTGVYYR